MKTKKARATPETHALAKLDPEEGKPAGLMVQFSRPLTRTELTRIRKALASYNASNATIHFWPKFQGRDDWGCSSVYLSVRFKQERKGESMLRDALSRVLDHLRETSGIDFPDGFTVDKHLEIPLGADPRSNLATRPSDLERTPRYAPVL